VRPVIARDLDQHLNGPSPGRDGRAELGTGTNRSRGHLFGPHHLRVVLWLVALVGDLVKDNIDRPVDDNFAVNRDHVIPSIRSYFHRARSQAHSGTKPSSGGARRNM
jgi:hypothetical protein